MFAFYLLLVSSCLFGSSLSADLETNSTTQANRGMFGWLNDFVGIAARRNETNEIGNVSETLYSIILRSSTISKHLNDTSSFYSRIRENMKKITDNLPEFDLEANFNETTRKITIDTKPECSTNRQWCMTIRLYIGEEGRSELIGQSNEQCSNQRKIHMNFDVEYEIPEYKYITYFKVVHSCNNINRHRLEFSGDTLLLNRLLDGDLLNRSDIKPTPAPTPKIEETPWYWIPVFN